MVENEGVVIPPHLMSVLQQNEYESVDELRADIASKDEEERDAIWEKADRCALMRALFPYKNPDGTTSKIGRKVTGWLASDLRVSGQQVRRYMKLGYYFPPDLRLYNEETGELTRTVLIRDPATPINLYLTALKAEDYGLEPLFAILKALDNEWSAGQLWQWIKEDQFREAGVTPPVAREWFRNRAEGPDKPTVRQMLEDAIASAEQRMDELARRGEQPLAVTVTIRAVEPPEVKQSV